MKRTLVVGLFDDENSARNVLRQLADSPLDLRDVSVLNRNADVQKSLREEGGVPADRTIPVAAAVGAVVGAAVGVLASATIPALGPALNAAVGGTLGAILAAGGAVVASPLKIPPAHRAVLATAVDAGATVIIVRAEGAPTAEAIGDLFRAYGARDLTGASPPGPDEPLADLVPAELTSDGGETPAREEDEIFRPPERRAGVQAVQEDGV